jgi:uncharacterized tellurite resistance protein B-like protein
MRKSKLPLRKLYAFVSRFLKRIGPNRQAKRKGRPQKYEDALIITLWLFQILKTIHTEKPLKKQKMKALMCHHFAITTTELNGWMMNF